MAKKPAAAKPRRIVKLPNVWLLTKKATLTLWEHKRLFVAITLIYGLLNLVLVQGLASGTDVGSLKDQLSSVFTGNFGAIASSLSIFAVLVGSSGNGSSQTAGAYQLFIALITSLAIIWALRQVLLGNKLRARDAYYRGMYPLVPFILVLLIVGLQLIPLIVGSSLYSIVISNGIAVYFVEKLMWAVAFGLLGLLSAYMLSSSLFALYIVTLPDMTPMKALRSARELVRHRRWTVLRKVLCLPVILLVAAALIMVPIIIVLTPLAQWIFFLLTMFSLAAVHAYMYTLYRELLNE
ncbi:MAG: hypothetical protein JWO35_28 [Candidatus Saccharibacteria bacterium]|nr:hypothetical protein [Candidatus Saccharibacteria bacterium]